MMKQALYSALITALLFPSCSGKKNPKDGSGLDSNTPVHQPVKVSNDITGNYHLPPLAKAGEGAYLAGQLLYELDNKPTPQCHASTIVETPTGLVAAFFAGTHEKNDDVGIRISRFVDGKWTWPEEVANGVESATVRYPTWNPVLFQSATGPLMLFYKVGPDPITWWGMMMASDDGGKTWSKPWKLGKDKAVGHLLGPVKNKPVQIADGTIICPSSTEHKNAEGDVDWMVHFEFTKDMGKTWEVVGPINDGVTFDAIQPSILTYADNKMQVLCRTRQNVISESWSEDGGKTWSEMTATNLPNPNSGTDAVTLKDNRQLLVYNHTTKEGEEPKGRNMLNLAVSDDGVNWTPVITLENEPAKAGYSYPAIIQTTDGLVHITYTYLRQSVKHVVINPALL
jgi:predicted neuraminidase